MDAILSDYAAICDQSKAQVVRDLLDLALPSIERVASLLKEVQKVKAEDMGAFVAEMNQAVRSIEQAVPHYAKIAEAEGKAPEGGEHAAALADARGPGLPQDPLSSNRGVRNRKQGKSKGKPYTGGAH
jgi:hypothetical protein